jgi:hypothetical protein
MGSHPSSASRPWRSSRAGAADAVHGSFLVSLRWPCDPRRHGATWRAATSWRASTGMAWPARRAAAGTVPVPRPAGGAGPAAIRAAGAALLLPSNRRHPTRAGGRAQGWLGQPGALPQEPSRFHVPRWPRGRRRSVPPVRPCSCPPSAGIPPGLEGEHRDGLASPARCRWNRPGSTPAGGAGPAPEAVCAAIAACAAGGLTRLPRTGRHPGERGRPALAFAAPAWYSLA